MTYRLSNKLRLSPLNTYSYPTLFPSQYDAEQKANEYIHEWERKNDNTIPLDLHTFIVNLSDKIADNKRSVRIELIINITYIPQNVHTLIYGVCTRLVAPLSPSLRVLHCINVLEIPELPEGLEYLYCRSNINIYKLPHLPISLRKLDIGLSSINELPLLPPNLEYLDCESIQITEFFSELPSGLKVLRCGGNKVPTICPLPPSLEEFYCREYVGYFPDFPSSLKKVDIFIHTARYFDQKIQEYIQNRDVASRCLDFRPLIDMFQENMLDANESIELLNMNGFTIPYIPDDIDTIICKHLIYTLPPLPSGLKTLRCGGVYEIPELPEGLEILDCSKSWITTLPVLPQSLRQLLCSSSGIHEFPELPPRLEVLECERLQMYKYCNLPELPDTLRVLRCKQSLLQSVQPLPPRLEILDCRCNFISDIGPLPPTLKVAEYGDQSELVDI